MEKVIRQDCSQDTYQRCKVFQWTSLEKKADAIKIDANNNQRKTDAKETVDI